MNDYVEQLKSVINGTMFYSSSSYSYFGKESAKLPSNIRRALTPRTARNYLLYQLQSQLYTESYIRGAMRTGTWNDIDSAVDIAAFVELLSAANAGNGSWEDGWEVLLNTTTEVVVKKTGLALWVRPTDCAKSGGGPIEPGNILKLKQSKELLCISPGYYLAVSDEGNDFDDTSDLVRLYWNLKKEGAEVFVREATRMLNAARLYFRLKVLNNPRSYIRCDAAVVYLRKSDYPTAVEIVTRIYSQVARYLKSSAPMFTKLLAPGVGLAEDPGLRESFGQHRCRLLADGLIRAFEEDARVLEDRLAVVKDCYASAGITLEHPYLNPKSLDIYTFQSS